MVINPGALAHYSYVLREALAAVGKPAIEVHLTDIRRRESWRRRSVLKDVCESQVLGKGKAELVERPNVGGEWVPIATRMSYRYLGENGPTYLTSTMKQPRWLFKIKPIRFETWQGVGWAPRYWVEGTDGPSYEEAHASV